MCTAALSAARAKEAAWSCWHDFCSRVSPSGASSWPPRPVACAVSSEAHDRGRASAVYEARLEKVTSSTVEKGVGIATFTILGGGDGLGPSVALKGWMKLDGNPCPSVSITLISDFEPGRIYRILDVSHFPGPDPAKLDLRFERLVVYGP